MVHDPAGQLHRARVQLVREAVASDPVQIRGPVDVARFLRDTMKLDREAQERFVGIYLDSRHRILHYATITVGILDASLIHPREVFRPAVASLPCSGVIVAHNHPSGDPTPSPEDRAVTRQLCEAGRALGIPLLDHLVMGEGGRWVALGEGGATERGTV